MSRLKTTFAAALFVLSLAGTVSIAHADAYDDAVAHPGRLANDLKRDPTDKPAAIPTEALAEVSR